MYNASDFGLLIFRVAISLFMFFGHGLGKLSRLFSGEEIKFFNFLGTGPVISLTLASFAEAIAPLLIVFGLFTRLSSLSLVVTMAVAAFIAHSDDPFSRQEKALMYLFSYLLLFITGPGKYSLQRYIDKKLGNLKGIIKYTLG